MTFVSEEEVLNLRKIERFIECKFKPRMVEGFAYTHRVNLETTPKSKKGGKPSKPGSSQRKRAKPAHGKPGSSEKSGKPSSAKKRSGFKHTKKKASDKREGSFGNKRSASSKPKSKKKSWSKKRRPAQGRKPKNS
jgi:hypothetical protein